MNIEIFKTTFDNWKENNSPRKAAALAYYSVFSLAPLLIVVITIAGLFFNEQRIQEQVTQQVQETVGAGAGDLVQNILNSTYSNPSGGFFATILGLAFLLIAAANIFVQLKKALNEVWHIEPGSSDGPSEFIAKRLYAAVLVIISGFILAGIIAVSVILPDIISDAASLAPAARPIVNLIMGLISFALLVGALMIAYRYLPDTELSWGDVLPGSILAGILFILSQLAVTLYLQFSSITSAYGAAGSLVVLLLWIFLIANFFLYGAEFIHTYETSEQQLDYQRQTA